MAAAGLQTFTSIMDALVRVNLVNINENYMALMSDNGEVREDLRVPDSEVGKEIEAKFEANEDFMVTVISAMGEECAVATKVLANK